MYINRQIENIIENNMMDYAQYVIKNRALPDLYSGMKPIHIKILWSMFENKTFNFTKSANVSGKVMVYSPHGDCYETIVNMVQKDRHIYNLIEGQGNWGSSCSTEMQYAASRYTECKMSSLGIDCMQGISKNMVELIDNYDSSSKMPKYLPTRFPLILCMASNGIAVGMANNSPSFNLEDVCNATISYLKNEEIPILIPDFATGSYILNDLKELKNINFTGKGNITLRAKYKIKDNTIIITEIPYGVKINIESIIDKILEKCKKGELKEITNVLNQTGIDGLNIEITCKKGTDMDKLMKKLYALTPLQSNFSVNMNVLVEGKPMVLGVHDSIKKWTKFRQKCIVKGLQYDIDKLKSELHLLHGFKKVLLDIDKTVDIIRHSNNVETDLIKFFKIDEIQVNNIVNMKLKNINKDYIIKQISEIEDMESKLDELKITINDPNKINDLIIKDLQDVIKKFKKARKTEIISMENSVENITKKDLIDDYNCSILVTKENYIKKLIRNSDNQRLKDGDTIIDTIQTSNNTELTLISNKNNLYRIKTYELDEHKPSQLGTYLNSILDLENEEYILKIIAIPKEIKDTEFILYCFENGKMAKINLKSFKLGVNKIINKAYNTNSKIINIFQINKDIDILLKSNIDKVLISNTSFINSKASKNTNGSQIQKQKKDSITELCIPLSQVDIEKIEDIEYYKSQSGKGIGNFKKKTDEIELIK